MGIIRIIGVGHNGAESLNAKTLKLIEEADLLVGAERLLGFFPAVRATRVVVKANLDEIVNVLKSTSSQSTVVLASGDPGFHGIAKHLVNSLGKEKIEIIPNVSSVQLAFARIKDSWDDATVCSVHGKGMGELIGIVQSNYKTAVLTDNVNTPSAIAKHLLSAGIGGVIAFVCENLGSEKERVTESSLEDLVGSEYSSLNVLVLLNEGRTVVQQPVSWTIGIPDDEFYQRKPLKGLITKAEIRVVSLAKLAIKPDSIVWDVGAGSGSVSIEAAMLAVRGRVFAIERYAEDVSIVRRNVDKFRTSNVAVVAGEAPEALAELPNPDAVFIGGSGGKMREIVGIAAGRISANGSIVINVTTIENLPIAVAALRDNSLTVEVTQLAVARGKPVGSLTRLDALDPIFIVSGKKIST